jgi:hypothetical protein
MGDALKVYRVRDGFRFGMRKQYGPGDRLTLTEGEAAGFLDKLEPIANAMDEAAQEPGAEASFPDIPSDWLAFEELGKHLHMVRLLVENGYATPDAVRMASDDDLLAIKGIGRKALGALRSVLGAG